MIERRTDAEKLRLLAFWLDEWGTDREMADRMIACNLSGVQRDLRRIARAILRRIDRAYAEVAPSEGLDVERLARALARLDERIVESFPEEAVNLTGLDHELGRDEYATAIAREYAALDAKEPTE